MSLLERDAALQDAHVAIEQARLGRGATVLVAGEAGIGKTTLIAQVLADAGPALRVFQGGCEGMTSARPLGPLRDIVHAHALTMAAALDDSTPADAVFSSDALTRAVALGRLTRRRPLPRRHGI